MEASAKIVELIAITANRGKGTENDPVRDVILLYTFGGRFVAERDTWKDKSLDHLIL